MSRVSHQMGTLLIFDGLVVGNWLLLSLDFPVLLEFLKTFTLCLKKQLSYISGEDKVSWSVSKHARLKGGNLLRWLNSLLPGHVSVIVSNVIIHPQWLTATF